MRLRIAPIYKFILLLSLIVIPYYIHRVRIDRILRQYTQKSNASHIILKSQKTFFSELKKSYDYTLFHSEVLILPERILFKLSFQKLFPIFKENVLYRYSALPPPKVLNPSY